MVNEKRIIEIGFIIVLLILAGALIFSSFKACDVNIDYDVTVDSFSNNTQVNLPEVKLACFKLCMEQLKGSNSFEDCLEKCEGLK